MDHQQILLIGGLTFGIAIALYIAFGSSRIGRRRKGEIVGLVNLGATCFLNTLLQALASCAQFVEWLDHHSTDEKTLTSSLRQVLWILNGETHLETHSPEAVLAVLKRHGWFLPAGEQDAHELFHCIVSSLQDENKKTRLAGSLSDALPVSDTLSQASDILDDTFEANLELESNQTEEVSEEQTQEVSDEQSQMSGRTNYEDAESTNKCDSDSQSLGGQEFYSVDSGGGSDETLKFHSPHKTNLTKLSMEKLRSSQESIRRGIFDRSGAPSPPSLTSEFPPFQGLLASSLQCHVCKNASSVRTDTFDSLSLPLGEPTHVRHSLHDLLRQFVRTEIIPDVDCEKCGKKTHALKTYNFGKLPPCLCLHISRTAWHSSSGTSSKRHDYVDFPEYLVMDPFTWKPGSSPPSPPSAATAKHLYRLKSVVVHQGGVSSGHFLTFRRGPLEKNRRHMKNEKNQRSCMDSNSWFMASDEHVQESTLGRVMDSHAYMLFYEKCSSNILSALLGEPAIVY